MKDIPILGHAAFYFEDIAARGVGAGDLFNVQVDERIFLHERFDGGFDVGRLHLGEHAQLSFLLCLGYDFVAVGDQRVASGIRFFLCFNDGRGRCGGKCCKAK
jgi:hypothetical protein